MLDMKISSTNNFQFADLGKIGGFVRYNRINSIKEWCQTSLGDKLKAVLVEKMITQKELAKKLNIAPTTLNGYISNKRQPDLETVKAIALSLGVSTDYLLECQSGGLDLSAKEMALIWQLRKLTPSQRDVVVDLISVMTEKNR